MVVDDSANPQERLKETVEVAKALQGEGYTSIGLYGFCCKSFKVTSGNQKLTDPIDMHSIPVVVANFSSLQYYCRLTTVSDRGRKSRHARRLAL